MIPRRRPDDPKPRIGVAFPKGLIIDGSDKHPGGFPGTPAAEAGFQPNDRLVAIRPVPQPGEEPSEFLPLQNGGDVSRYAFAFRHRPVEFQVERQNERITIRVEPNHFRTFGLRMKMGPIVAVVDERYRPEPAHPFRTGDVIIALDGDPDVEPMRLPDQVTTLAEQGKTFTIRVARPEAGDVDIVIDGSKLPPRGTWNEEQPISIDDPVSIPILGIAYNVEPVIEAVASGSAAAEAGLQPGETITSVHFTVEDDEVEYDPVQWPSFFFDVQTRPPQTYHLTVRSPDGRERQVTLEPRFDTDWPLPNWGLIRRYDQQRIHADSVGQAIVLGFRDTHRSIGRIYLNLRSLLTGEVRARDNLYGPLRLLGVTYKVARRGLSEFIFLLGMISINLAVINFLPIPVLDGGHMIFLIVEKLRGKPASERALVIANLVGLVFIVSLMLFVIFLDLSSYDFFKKLF